MMCVSGYLHSGKEGNRLDTEEKIILAAVNQFKINGFSGATTKAIAAEAGVAEVTLFRYFGNKKTLFLKTAEYIGTQFGLMDIPNQLSGDFRQDVYLVCQQLLRHFIRSNELIRMLIFEVKKYRDAYHVLLDIRHKAMANIRQMVCRYPETDTCKCTTDSLEWLMSSLIGASLSYHQFHAGADEDAFVLSQAGLISSAFVNQITKSRM